VGRRVHGQRTIGGVDEARRDLPRWIGRGRRIAAPILVVLFAVSFSASGVGTWLHRSTLDEDVWAERVVPLGTDPEVQAALAAWTNTQLAPLVDTRAVLREALPDRADVLAAPLSSAVTAWVAHRVDRFFASGEFERLWATVTSQAHEAAVRLLRRDPSNVEVGDHGVTIDLVPVIAAVLADIADRAPALVGSTVELPSTGIEDAPGDLREQLGRTVGVDLPPGFGTITIDDGGALAGTRRGVELFDRIVLASLVLTVLAALAALATSPYRRRTAFQLLGAAALAALAVRRVTLLLQDQIVELVEVEANRAAASAVVHRFTDPFTDAAAATTWVVVAATILLAVTGPYRWATRLRTTAAGVVGSAIGTVGAGTREVTTTRWAIGHADALRLAGYGGGALALWFVDVSWSTLLVVAAVVTAWQIVLVRITRREPPPDEEVFGPAPGATRELP
jgi:hypothetical protein